MTVKTTDILYLAECLHDLNCQSYLSEKKRLENFRMVEDFADYCELTQVQAMIFASCVIIGYSGSSMTEIFDYLGMHEYHMLRYKKDIDTLFKRKLIEKSRKGNRRDYSFNISDEVYHCISTNSPLPQYNEEEKEGLVDLLQEFEELKNEYEDGLISEFELQMEFIQLMDGNEEQPLFVEMANKLDTFESYFFLSVVCNAVNAGNNKYNTLTEMVVSEYYSRKSLQLMALSNLTEGFSSLTKSDFIELENSEFRNLCRARLSKRMLKFLNENEGITLKNMSSEDSKLLSASAIPTKKLIYNERTEEQISQLRTLLGKGAFHKLQNRLKSKSMPKGMAVLFYGEPGTGKTETVYQLAKSTGRSIFQVDISETRSMWFGESQRLVKKIFSDYYELKKTEKEWPILLFNEADAVIGKRKAAGSSRIADTENSIQNILLEELERFQGILFATTNLVDNMDAAFERRFLFKICFDKPEIETAAEIWKIKLPFINHEQAIELAANYPFSGGEIENIARRCLLKEILDGKDISFKQLKTICSEEKWNKQSVSKIGFCKN